MKIRNTKDVGVDEVQCYLTHGVYIHPELYHQFLAELKELEYKRQLCILPQYRMSLYTLNMKRRIAACLAA